MSPNATSSKTRQSLSIYIYIWERPINCLLKLVEQKKRPRKEQNTETKGCQPRRAGSQQLACQRARPQVGALASQQSSRAAKQYLGQPASSQPARGLVCQPGGQPGGHQPAGSQGAIRSHNGRPATEPFLDDSITKTAKPRKKKKADPGRNKNWVSSPARRLVDHLVSQQPPASCPVGQ